MKSKKKLLFSVLFVLGMVLLFAVPAFAKPAANPKLNKKALTIIAGKSVKLKVTGTKKTPKWSSSDKSVATVSKKGVVKARKAGKVIIKAKVGKKTLKCKVLVFGKKAPKTPTLLGTQSGGKVDLTFNQDGWYVARLEVQVYDKQTREYSYLYSDSCAINEKAKVTVDTDKYDIARIGFQIWYFGWDNFYFNLPYSHTNYATTFTLSGYGDYPDFKWQ